jgi:hypothetical protein
VFRGDEIFVAGCSLPLMHSNSFPRRFLLLCKLKSGISARPYNFIKRVIRDKLIQPEHRNDMVNYVPDFGLSRVYLLSFPNCSQVIRCLKFIRAA